MPRFTEQVESAVEALSANPSQPVDENEFIDASRLVYDGIRDIRKAVLMIRVSCVFYQSFVLFFIQYVIYLSFCLYNKWICFHPELAYFIYLFLVLNYTRLPCYIFFPELDSAETIVWKYRSFHFRIFVLWQQQLHYMCMHQMLLLTVCVKLCVQPVIQLVCDVLVSCKIRLKWPHMPGLQQCLSIMAFCLSNTLTETDVCWVPNWLTTCWLQNLHQLFTESSLNGFTSVTILITLHCQMQFCKELFKVLLGTVSETVPNDIFSFLSCNVLAGCVMSSFIIFKTLVFWITITFLDSTFVLQLCCKSACIQRITLLKQTNSSEKETVIEYLHYNKKLIQDWGFN